MNVNQIINKIHAETVEQVMRNIMDLPKEEREMLFAEFQSNPDARFSNNILMACSVLQAVETLEGLTKLLFFEPPKTSQEKPDITEMALYCADIYSRVREVLSETKEEMAMALYLGEPAIVEIDNSEDNKDLVKKDINAIVETLNKEKPEDLGGTFGWGSCPNGCCRVVSYMVSFSDVWQSA